MMVFDRSLPRIFRSLM
uniref:Uncharacterized protein n=1 Tax=Anguilla anguilla TaxID=7936 RepID=A0A0E9STG2_ANGAN